jgi:hypothetical protein
MPHCPQSGIVPHCRYQIAVIRFRAKELNHAKHD